MSMLYYVYLLECKDGSIYTGITTDLHRRLSEHQRGTGGYYTRARGALCIRYSEEHATRSSALRREAEVKTLTREKKLALIIGPPLL